MAADSTYDMVIDCNACPDRGARASCEGCIVSFLIERPPGALVFDVEEARALRALRDGGLLPGIRLDKRTG